MDERFREIQRRAQSGERRAQAELLNLYIRTSKIPRHRVELAAIYGDPAAMFVAPPQLTEEEFLFLTVGCRACGGTGLIVNTGPNLLDLPNTWPCECTEGLPFEDAEIYIRRALIALDFVLNHLYSTYGTARINILQNINQSLLSYVKNCGAELVGCNEFDDFAAIARQNLALYDLQHIGWDRLSILAEAYTAFLSGVVSQNHHQKLTLLSWVRTHAMTVLATEDPDEYEMFSSPPPFYPEQVAEDMVKQVIAEKMIPWLLTPEDTERRNPDDSG